MDKDFFIWHISELQTLLYAETNRLKQQLNKLTFLKRIPDPLAPKHILLLTLKFSTA